MHKTWYEQLGFLYNPFTIKPGFFSDEVVGYDKEIERLVNLMKDGEVAFLEGAYGQGKTTILKYLINEFPGEVIYLSRNRSDRAVDYGSLLKRGFLGRFGVKARNQILIVDETEKINTQDCADIEKYLDSGHFRSALFIDASMANARLTPSLRKRIDKHVITLKPLHEKDAVALVRSRLDGNTELISDVTIKKIYAKSEKNTRSFLLAMEEVFRYAIEKGGNKVVSDDVEKTL